MENIGICLPQPGYLEAVREITRRLRHAADLRRGQDRHHRRVGRRDRCARRAARSRRAGQEHRRRPAARRVRRQARVHGSDHRRAGCCTSARTTATRCAWRRRRRCSPRSARPKRRRRASPSTTHCSTPATTIIDRAGLPAHTVQFGAKGCVTWAADADPQLPRLQGHRLRPRLRAVDPRHQPRRAAAAGPRRAVADLGDAQPTPTRCATPTCSTSSSPSSTALSRRREPRLSLSSSDALRDTTCDRIGCDQRRRAPRRDADEQREPAADEHERQPTSSGANRRRGAAMTSDPHVVGERGHHERGHDVAEAISSRPCRSPCRSRATGSSAGRSG